MKAFSRLRLQNEEVPNPFRLPTEQEVAQCEQSLQVHFPSRFKDYLLQVSDVVYGSLEPVTIAVPESHTDLEAIAKEAWASGVPKALIPICEDNGDYYCVNELDEVVFWSHIGCSREKWLSIDDWIEDVWLQS